MSIWSKLYDATFNLAPGDQVQVTENDEVTFLHIAEQYETIRVRIDREEKG